MNEPIHTIRFPGETDEYRRARDELLYHTEAPGDKQDPMATVFVRRSGKIHHFWSSELYFAPTDPGQHPRHVDFMWPLWNVLDRTPEGRGSDWNPQLKYS